MSDFSNFIRGVQAELDDPNRTMRCDFCSSELIVTEFRAKSFDANKFGINQRSEGDWCACYECAKLVRAKDRPKLLERSFTLYFERHPEARSLNRQQRRKFRKEMQGWHGLFWDNLLGEAEIPTGVYRVIDQSVAPDPVRERVRQIMLSSMDADQRALFEKDWDEAEAKDDA